MKHFTSITSLLLLVLAAVIGTVMVDAQEGLPNSRFLRRRHRRWRGGNQRGNGWWRNGWGNGWGGGGGGGAATTTASSTNFQDLIQKLRQNRNKIDREVVDIDGGVETTTKAKNSNSAQDKIKINNWIYDHIEQMKEIAESNGRVRQWDDLFVDMFDNIHKLNLTCDYESGVGTPVVCTHTGDDCYAEALTKAHAEAVSLFLKNRNEMSKDHGYLVGQHYDEDC